MDGGGARDKSTCASVVRVKRFLDSTSGMFYVVEDGRKLIDDVANAKSSRISKLCKGNPVMNVKLMIFIIYHYISLFMNHSSTNIHSECSESAKNEILLQLDELKKHSGKDSSDILPRLEKIITKPVKNKKGKVRERLNATVIHTST